MLVLLQPFQKALEQLPAALVRESHVYINVSFELTSFPAVTATAVERDPDSAAHTAEELEGTSSHFESDSKCVLILARSCSNSRWYGCNRATRGATQ